MLRYFIVSLNMCACTIIIALYTRIRHYNEHILYKYSIHFRRMLYACNNLICPLILNDGFQHDLMYIWERNASNKFRTKREPHKTLKNYQFDSEKDFINEMFARRVYFCIYSDSTNIIILL